MVVSSSPLTPVLRLEPADVDARQTKLFLLLQTEQYSAALDLIEQDANAKDHAYERVYSLYRLQHESEARDILEVLKEEKGEDDRGIVHLEAQLVGLDFASVLGSVLPIFKELPRRVVPGGIRPVQ